MSHARPPASSAPPTLSLAREGGRGWRPAGLPTQALPPRLRCHRDKAEASEARGWLLEVSCRAQGHTESQCVKGCEGRDQ